MSLIKPIVKTAFVWLSVFSLGWVSPLDTHLEMLNNFSESPHRQSLHLLGAC